VHVTLDNYEPDEEDDGREDARHNWLDVVRCEGRVADMGSSCMAIRPRPEKKDPSLLTR